MSDISITSGPGWAKVKVDGVELSRLTGVSANFEVASLPVITVTMAVMDGDVEAADGVLKIGGVEMPESVEKALLEYLCAKYPMRTMVARSVGGLVDVAKA